MKVVIRAPENAAIGEIELYAPPSDLMEIGHPYSWSGAQNVRAVSESVIALGKAPQTNEMFFEWLLSIEAGLTLVSLLRGRLRPRPPGQGQTGPQPLADLGVLNQITLEDGRSGYIAVWDPFLLSGQVEEAAERTGHVEFRAPLSRLRTLGGVSALIPKGGSDGKTGLSLEDISKFPAPRISQALGGGPWSPLPKKSSRILPPVSAETASRMTLLWSGRGRPPKGVNVPEKTRSPRRPPRILRSGSGWADPFLPIFRCGVPVSPPIAALDRMAIDLCERVRLQLGADNTRSKIAHALSAAYRIGADPERVSLTKALPIPPSMRSFLKDRSHAIIFLLPAGGPIEDMRRLFRICALEAWWYGAIPIRRVRPPIPARRFREELPPLLRDLQQERPPSLKRLIRCGSGAVPADLWALLPDRAFADGGVLRPEWREALLETVSAPRYDLPSLLDLLEPTPQSIEALRPSWVGVDAQDERVRIATNDALTSLEPLLEGAVSALLSSDRGGHRDVLLRAAVSAWRLGRAPTGPIPDGELTGLTEPTRSYLEEGVRLIETALSAAGIGPDSLKGAALARDLLHDAWRTALTVAEGTPPPARFLEGAPAGLRHLSAEDRGLLFSLLEGDAPVGSGGLDRLVRFELVIPTSPPELTPDGVGAAEAERRHRSRGLPLLADFVGADLLRKRASRSMGSEEGNRIELDRIARSLARNEGSRRLINPDRYKIRLRIALNTSYPIGRDPEIGENRAHMKALVNAAVKTVLEETSLTRLGDDPAELERIIRAACYKVSGTGLEPHEIETPGPTEAKPRR